MTVMTVKVPYKPREVQRQMHRAMNRNRFCVIVAHRRCGKTVAVVNQLIKKAMLCTLRFPRYGYVAPYYGQAKEIAWDYLKHFTARIPGTKVNQSDLSVLLPTGAKIKLYGADNPDSLRGTYFDGVVLDEVAQMKPEVWGEIVRPSLSDRNGWAVFIGTPKGVNVFYDLYQHALHDDSWGAEFFPADSTDVLPQEELDAARATMSDAQYRQEFQCDFQAAVEDVLISIDVVNQAARRVHHPTAYNQSPVILGVDVARFGDDKSVIVKRQGVVASILAVVKDYDLMRVADIVAQQIAKEKPAAVFVDVVGIGAGVVDRLRQLGHRIVAVNAGESPGNPQLYVNKRAEMWCRMSDWLRESGSIPDDKQLRNDLVSLTYSFDANSRYKLERKEDAKRRGVSSPDCFVAGTLVRTNKGQVPIEEINVGDRVVTPFGASPVIAKHITDANTLTTVKFSNSKLLIGKGKHDIFTFSSCIKRLDALSLTDEVEIYSQWRFFLWKIVSVFSTKAKSFGFKRLAGTFNQEGRVDRKDFCTEEYGLNISVRYRRALMSIIEIATSVITELKTWNFAVETVTGACTCSRDLQRKKKNGTCIWLKPELKLPNGMRQKMELSGTENTVKRHGKIENHARLFVPDVGKDTSLISRQDQSTAHQPACNRLHSVLISQTRERVHSAAKNLWQIVIGRRPVVPVSVVTDCVIPTKTYNLTLESHNAYYANDILVFNCGDALALTFSHPVAPQTSVVLGKHTEQTVDDSPIYYKHGSKR